MTQFLTHHYIKMKHSSQPDTVGHSIGIFMCKWDVPLQPQGYHGVSQSVDLGRRNNPNTTPTKDYEIVRIQHNAHVIGWMSNAGGEYKSDLFD